MDKDMIINNIKEELGCLVFIASRIDYKTEESIQIENEFKEALEKDATLDGLENLNLIVRVDSMFCRCWLVSYKKRGFILQDIGNCHWSFVCNADEAMYRIATKDFSSEYIKYE